MEFFSAIKRNEILLPFAATQVDLEIIILTEVRSDKDKYYMIFLIHGS